MGKYHYMFLLNPKQMRGIYLSKVSGIPKKSFITGFTYYLLSINIYLETYYRKGRSYIGLVYLRMIVLFYYFSFSPIKQMSLHHPTVSA